MVELSDQEKIRRLPWLYAHAAGNSVFSILTFFGPVFVLFLNELGLPKGRIGFLLSLLPFCGLVAIVIAPAVARTGVKRVFIVCWALRKVVTGLLLVIPWVVAAYGTDAGFAATAGIVALFALLRAVGETAWYPWGQEIIPAPIRGRVTGINNIAGLLAGCLALAGASWAIDHVEGLQRFTLLIGIGVAFGVICVFCALPIPGGGPDRVRDTAHLEAMARALRDQRFRLYLLYAALVLVTMQSLLGAFFPLFAKDEVGLSEGQVVLLQVSSYVAGLVASYAWGKLSDRQGSLPVLRRSLVLLGSLPLCWLIMPRHEAWSYPIGMAIAALAGVASTGWWVSDQRLLYVNLVPPERRTEYMAIYYAWIGLIGGFGPLIAGAALDHFQGLRGAWWVLSFDPYSPLFLTGLLFLGASVFLLARLQCDAEVTEAPDDPPDTEPAV